MELVTTLYPVFENKCSDGGFYYGFLTGERKGKDGLFVGSGLIVRHFKKRQSFVFCAAVKSKVSVSESTSDDKSGFIKRFKSKKVQTVELEGEDVDDVNINEEGDDDDE